MIFLSQWRMSPGSILTESAKIWKKDTATAPSFLSSTNHLQEGDVVKDEHTICYGTGKTTPRYGGLVQNVDEQNYPTKDRPSPFPVRMYRRVRTGNGHWRLCHGKEAVTNVEL